MFNIYLLRLGYATTFVGSLSGGLLPLFWAGVLAVPAVDPSAARWALVISLPLVVVK
jgi:hypothetical protein